MKILVGGLGILIALPVLLGLVAPVWPDAEFDAEAQKVPARQFVPVAEGQNLCNGRIGYDAPKYRSCWPCCDCPGMSA